MEWKGMFEHPYYWLTDHGLAAKAQNYVQSNWSEVMKTRQGGHQVNVSLWAVIWEEWEKTHMKNRLYGDCKADLQK